MKVEQFLLFIATIIAATRVLAFFDLGDFPLIEFSYPALAALAAYGTYSAMKRESGSTRKVLGLLTMGLVAWFFADLSWSVYVEVLKWDVPFPSIADVFYVLGWVPFVAAFYYKKRDLFVAEKVNGLTHVLGALLLVWTAWVVYLNVQNSTGLELALNLFYIFAGFYIMYEYAFALSGSVLLKSSPFLRPWLFLAVGFFGFGVYNVAFARLTATDTYFAGHPIDLLYTLSYWMISVGAYAQLKAGSFFKQAKKK